MVAFGVGDFIDAGGPDLFENAVGETILDDPLHNAKYAVPVGVKYLSAVFPA